MGSRIMHLIIANEIADTLAIKDKSSFLIGGIAPDAVPTKDISTTSKAKFKIIHDISIIMVSYISIARIKTVIMYWGILHI
ncbi:hypothetical protein PALA111701_29060 [Paenibacillus lactis]